MSRTILFTGGTMPEEFQRKLENLGHNVINEVRPDLSEVELIERLQGVDAYILGGEEKATAKVIEAVKGKLAIVAFYGAGYESYVDLEAANRFGIAVSNTPAANARSVAEFTMALILASVKRIPFLVGETMQGRGKTHQTWNLQGGTLGILGMGAIGSEVAYIAHHGFGMQILYTSRSNKPNIEAALAAQKVNLNDLMRHSDVVSLHASYSPETINIIGEEQIALMKERSVLVNTARAELIEPKALRRALEEGKIWGAALDVYYKEPVPAAESDEYGFVGMSPQTVLLTPHTAFRTRDAVALMLEMNINSILSVFSGTPDRNVVNRDVLMRA